MLCNFILILYLTPVYQKVSFQHVIGIRLLMIVYILVFVLSLKPGVHFALTVHLNSDKSQ